MLEGRAMMLKVVLAVAATTTALAFAGPASAQHYPRGYGYSGQYSDVSGIETRIQNVLGRIDSYAPYEVRYQLRREAMSLHQRVQYAARTGLDPWALIGDRLTRLELEVQRYGPNGYNRYNGDRRWHGHRGDRDRD
jgi:hypothetical protein